MMTCYASWSIQSKEYGRCPKHWCPPLLPPHLRRRHYAHGLCRYHHNFFCYSRTPQVWGVSYVLGIYLYTYIILSISWMSDWAKYTAHVQFYLYLGSNMQHEEHHESVIVQDLPNDSATVIMKYSCFHYVLLVILVLSIPRYNCNRFTSVTRS